MITPLKYLMLRSILWLYSVIVIPLGCLMNLIDVHVFGYVVNECRGFQIVVPSVALVCSITCEDVILRISDQVGYCAQGYCNL